MKVKVKGSIRDLLAFKGLVPKRRKRILKSPDTPLVADAVGELSRVLHPRVQHLVITGVKDETPSAKTFRLEPHRQDGTTRLAPFRAGQYVSIRTEVGGVRITRPYTISSSPHEKDFYEITLRRTEGGFLTGHAWEYWREGTKLDASGPEGTFFHEPLRDTPEILGLAGGSGVTPFRSMIKDIALGGAQLRLTLLYGIKCPDDIIFGHELREFADRFPEKIRVHYVCSEPDSSWEGPTGFLSAACIRDLAGDLAGKTVFVCGPPQMYRFLREELKAFNLRPKQIRWEAEGEASDIERHPGFPADAVGKSFRLTVTMGGKTVELPALSGESLLVAMERANLAPPSRCRSGECGFCRSRIVSGEVFVRPESDGRRAADRMYGHIHPCSSYPVSDVEIAVPRDP
ncbi:MAG: iron-sulfur cluster-binding domain-containing protein [Desulfomonilia bacterium]